MERTRSACFGGGQGSQRLEPGRHPIQELCGIVEVPADDRDVPLKPSRRIPSDDGSFDAVVSFLMLHHVVDWEAALREVQRVLLRHLVRSDAHRPPADP